MNTDVLVAAQGPLARDGMQAARDYIDAGERRFSRFQQASELSQLNRSAGKWFNASPEMLDVLQKARKFFDLTNGLFDPSVLPDLCVLDMIEAWTKSAHRIVLFHPPDRPERRKRISVNWNLILIPAESVCRGICNWILAALLKAGSWIKL